MSRKQKKNHKGKRNSKKNILAGEMVATKPLSDSRSPILSRNVLILFFASFLLYANTLNHGFAYDDYSVYINNSLVMQGVDAIPQILSTPYRYGYFETNNDLYRPLSQVLFAIEYDLFDASPQVGHLLNVLLYCICVIALFSFLSRIFGESKTELALIASLLFALHPIHTEVVANIKSRDELLCFAFAFIAIHRYLQYIDTAKLKHILLASGCMFLSLLSKETSVTIIGALPLILIFYEKTKKINMPVVISAMITVLTFLFIRQSVLTVYHADDMSDISFIDNFLVGASDIYTRLATAFVVLGRYILLLVFPYPLISDYSYRHIPYVGILNFWAIFSALLYLFMILFSLYKLYKSQYSPLLLGVFFFLITISIFSNLFFLTGAAMAERFLFFASVGFCIVLAAFVIKLVSFWNKSTEDFTVRRKKALFVLIPILVVYTGLTLDRSKEWENNLTLFESDVKKAPQNVKLKYFLASELQKTARTPGVSPIDINNNIRRANNLLHEAVTIYPEYGDAYRTLGIGFYLQKNYDSAEHYLGKAISLNKNDLKAWNNLDVVYYNAKEFSKSIEVCKEVIRITSDDHQKKYKNIATCFMQLGHYDSAVTYLRKAITIDENSLPLYKDIALAYKLNMQLDSAKKYEKLVRQVDQNFRLF